LGLAGFKETRMMSFHTKKMERSDSIILGNLGIFYLNLDIFVILQYFLCITIKSP
jgi:hypothetical protein